MKRDREDAEAQRLAGRREASDRYAAFGVSCEHSLQECELEAHCRVVLLSNGGMVVLDHC